MISHLSTEKRRPVIRRLNLTLDRQSPPDCRRSDREGPICKAHAMAQHVESPLEPFLTVHAAFERAARRWGNRPFLQILAETAAVYDIASGEMTFAEALTDVERLRDGYAKAGYQPGQRVMLLVENRPAFFLHWFALNALGLSVVPVNPDLRAAELEYMAGHAEPALAVAIRSRIAELRAVSQRSGVNFPVMALDEAPPAPGRSHALGASEPLLREAAMLYTSGTTGKPKGCILTNLYFLNAGKWYAEAGGLCALNTDGERMLTPLPIFHMNAMAYSLMAMVAVGGCLTVLDRFHPHSWRASVRESRATCLHYLGVMPSILMGAPESDADRLHGVRFGFGAGVDRKLQVPFEARFGFPLVEAWAMTETGAGAVIAANQEPRKIGMNCFGRPGADIDVRIVDDNGADQPANQPGEMLVRRKGADPRYGFFDGYHKNETATEEAWKDGWFHTGDIVMRDADGDILFIDRKKNVIRRSGENISAVEVESVLGRYPGIVAAAVAAVPDALRGDEVFACLAIEGSGSEALARAIVNWCLTQLAYYKAPGYVAFVPQLPLTSTQKIQRSELKALAARLLDDPATIDTRALKKRQAQ